MKWYFLLLILVTRFSQAQNLGGSATYSFLKLASSPQANAMGGVVVAVWNQDNNLVHQNPALLKPLMHKQMGANINFMYGGIKNMNANYSLHKEKIKTSFQSAINFINYGSLNSYDASGNETGSFNANDYTVQFSASRQYLEKWHYGVAMKLIGSNYGQFSSFGVALDVGITYTDSAKQLQIGSVFKNIGTQLKPYDGTSKEPLPFELQFGIAKKLQKAPFQLFATITHAHQFDIRYADTTFENEINGSVQKGKFTFDKLFRHFIIGTQIYPSQQTELTISYNYLRRKELGLFNIGNGFTGLSMGVGLIMKPYQIRYARSYYQNAKAFHQLGFTLDFKFLHK